MKKINKWWIYALLTLGWTGVIFAFSLQPANSSANLSGGLLQHLLHLWHQWTGIQIPINTVHRLFRKVAHFGEFFVLGTFACFWFRELKKSRLFPLGYCVLVAVSDETLQFFTGAGRSMRVTDMGIDILGSVSGILVISALYHLISKRKQKRC